MSRSNEPSIALTLTDPQNGNLAFKVFTFDGNSHFDHIQRNNYFSLIWVKSGHGELKADFSNYSFNKDSLFAFAPYQPYMITQTAGLRGVAIQFHPDFFCILRHHREIGSNGVLFNDVYNSPIVRLNEEAILTLTMVVDQFQIEMQNPELGQYELLISYLKIFLITVTRLKTQQQPIEKSFNDDRKHPFILQQLRDEIEKHFRTRHSASSYAELLNISPKALAKLTKTHFNKTLTDLIAERIVIEAKRELYLTNKPVKEIAGELGYDDEHYFSRFFKTNTDISPQLYRETVGFGRDA